MTTEEQLQQLMAMVENMSEQLQGMHDTFVEFRPMLDQLAMVNEAKTLRQKRRVLLGKEVLNYVGK